MASEKIQVPRGTYDVLPERWSSRYAIERAAAEILARAGYSRIETPTFEATELFSRGIGQSTDVVQKEMYSFDDGGGRSLTLRPEGTAPICRAYVEHGMHKLAQPVRLWYVSSFYRHEAPQAGRFRQFWQVGAEAIGSDSPALDAETVILLAELLERLGVKGTRLRLSSLGSPETRMAYRERLISYLREHESELSAEVRERIELNPLRAFDADDPGTKAVMTGAPQLLDQLDPDDRDHFTQVRELLDAVGLTYEIDGTLVRGLDYYTRTVFEFTSDALGAQSGVGGGGRYDGLIEQLGGPPTAGVGWAAGVERIVLAAGETEQVGQREEVNLYIALADPERYGDAFTFWDEARRAGLAVQQELAGRSLKGQLKQADRLGARYVVILGEGEVTLKNMQSGEQQTVALAEVLDVIEREVEAA